MESAVSTVPRLYEEYDSQNNPDSQTYIRLLAERAIKHRNRHKQKYEKHHCQDCPKNSGSLVLFTALCICNHGCLFLPHHHSKHPLMISITRFCCSTVILLSLGRHNPLWNISAPMSLTPPAMYALVRARPFPSTVTNG